MSHGDEAPPASHSSALLLVAVECPGCRAHLSVTRALRGGAVACPACKAMFLVPAPTPVPRADGPVTFAEPPLPSTRRRPDDAFVVTAEMAAAAPAARADPSVVGAPGDGGASVSIRVAPPSARRTRRVSPHLFFLLAGVALLAALVAFLVARGR